MSWSEYSRTQKHFRVWPLRGGPVNAFSHTLTHIQSKYGSQVSHSLSLCDCVKTNSHSLLVHLYARLFEIAGAQLCQIIEIAFFFLLYRCWTTRQLSGTPTPHIYTTRIPYLTILWENCRSRRRSWIYRKEVATLENGHSKYIFIYGENIHWQNGFTLKWTWKYIRTFVLVWWWFCYRSEVRLAIFQLIKMFGGSWPTFSRTQRRLCHQRRKPNHTSHHGKTSWMPMCN